MANETKHTVAHVLGEITWLLTQTPAFKDMPLSSLEATVMPAILLQQFRIFYEKAQPVAFATWATVSDAVDQSLTGKAANGETATLALAEWKSGPNRWLMELVSPFATEQNKLKDILLTQISQTIFGGQPFKACLLDPTTKTKNLAHMNIGEMGHG
ncbi:MAG: toxin-activating lysine-acyltransferase [Pseudomonadota bacterium]